MRGPRHMSAHALPLRSAATLGAVLLATTGLAACRPVPGEEPDRADRTKQDRAEQTKAAPESSAESAPESFAATSPTAAATTPSGDDASGSEAPVDATTPPGIAELEAAAAADDREEAAQAAASDDAASEAQDDAAADAAVADSAALGTTPGTESPRPLDPWRLVGQPYLVDDESPEAAADGKTSFTLWFRTRGDFRGVRAGTSVTDDRHFKVGFITVPELPGYVPGGVGMLQRSERMLQKGRYCWTAEIHLQGERGDRRFVLRRDGAPLQVQFDLRGAPVQRRTATVLVRNSTADAPAPTPVERALACR